MKTWQKIILRNYGIIGVEKLANIIRTDIETVKAEANRLGLQKLEAVNPDWVKKGFVTLIRNNWDLLSKEQIAYVLDMSVDELNDLLIEYDFLDIKLGEQPPLDNANYIPLSVEEIKETVKVAEYIAPYVYEEKVKPFDFFINRVTPEAITNGEYLIKERFNSSYYADYANALADDELKDYPEEYLDWLNETGTNGIWISETLKNLADFPLDRKYVGDYKRRVNNLSKLTERCHKHGINVYLYLNEPRSMPEEFFENYPQLKGQKTANGYYCLCTSTKEVQDYLYNAVKSLAENVPLLKGIMTISMSENPTHCQSIKWDDKSADTECPRCKNRGPEELCAEVNNIIARALKDGNGYTKLIANLWGWSDFMCWTDDMAFHGIDLLDKDIEILCVSEYGKDIYRGGVKCKIIDYSISEVGPSEITKKMLSYAKSKGHKIWAKVQMNNSWECSAMPYMPTFDLMTEHVKKLKALGVEGLMLGWSLGGYPGGALPLINRLCLKDFNDENGWYDKTYKECSALVKRAGELFSSAFKEFPFSVDSLYFGGQSLGCGNLWSLTPSNRKSTMVCFAFDDYEAYTKPYGLEIYILQYKKLTSLWAKGLELIEEVIGNDAFEEYKRYAKVAYIQFKSAENLVRFTKYKKNISKNLKELLECVNSETELTKMLLQLISIDAKIGYEMTNHYFYNRNLLLNKLINLKDISNEINKE